VHYKPLLDGAIELAAHKPEFCVIFQREQEEAHLEEGRDVDWHAFQYGTDPADCVPVEGNHPPISSTPPARPASPRAWCAHTAGISWR
jgi:propionyl-CoA synthetase